jgi:hypothetical protein
MEKMTNKNALIYVRENFAEMPADVAEKINAMIASLEQKSANRKPTKTQEQNEVLKADIMEILTADGMTATQVLKSTESLSTLSNQKVTSLLYSLEKDGKVVVFKDKKTTLFKVA